MVTLLASAARTSSGVGSQQAANLHPENWKRGRFVLNVTAAATEVGDLLDVYLQHTYDGVNWDDFAHFTQVLGNGGAKTHIVEWTRDVTPETELKAPADATLAVGVLQGLKLGVGIRAKWVIVDAGTVNASFTFSVAANPVVR